MDFNVIKFLKYHQFPNLKFTQVSFQTLNFITTTIILVPLPAGHVLKNTLGTWEEAVSHPDK